MTPREEIQALQEALFRKQRRLIAASVHGMTAEFRRYEAVYQRRVRTFAREATYGEVLHAVSTADLIYVGDYHTLKQSQRSFLKLIQRRWPKRPCVLALEFVQSRHQRVLDDFVAGRIAEGTFLEKTGALRHHVFDTWPHFRPLLEEAKALGLAVVGIDLMGSHKTKLAQRDAHAARRIADAALAHPGAQIFVLSGQLHVAPPHLPAAVARELAGRGHQLPGVTVYQNCERIWFELQRAGRELDVEATLVRPGEWCLMNTPPVVVQQSYLDWIDGGAEPLDSAPEARFKELALLVARALGLDGKKLRAALDDVQVWTAGELGFLSALPSRGFTRSEILAIERQILSRESYFIPRARLAYLANLSVNHAAEEATHFLRHVVSGAGEEPRPLIDGFYARALEEAFAFCGSKIVNPRRKCAHEADWRRLAKRAPEPFTRDVARLVLRHVRTERGELKPAALRDLYRSAGPELFNAVTHALGYMLGDRLYHALATGKLGKAAVRELFLDPLDDEGVPMLVYLDLTTRLAGVQLPPRS